MVEGRLPMMEARRLGTGRSWEPAGWDPMVAARSHGGRRGILTGTVGPAAACNLV